MLFLIDTNIFIYARDDRYGVLDRFAEHEGDIVLSAISLAELQRGLAAHEPEASIRAQRHRILINKVSVIAFDAAAARAYRDVFDAKGRVKTRDFDHLIAAHALGLGAILVTNNTADFAGIPGLVVENWAAPP